MCNAKLSVVVSGAILSLLASAAQAQSDNVLQKCSTGGCPTYVDSSLTDSSGVMSLATGASIQFSTSSYIKDASGVNRIRPYAGGSTYFYDQDGDTIMVVYDGRIGILDTTPSYPLDVLGTIRAQGADLRADGDVYSGDDILVGDDIQFSSSTGYIRDSSGYARIAIVNGGDLVLNTSAGAGQLYIDSTYNNVGIGTSSPAGGYDLDVHGNTQLGGGTLNLDTSSFEITDSNDYARIAMTAGGDMTLCSSNGGQVFTIDGTYHNVGIGTTAPSSPYKLHVVGNAYVSQTIWANDYIEFSRYPEDLAVAYAAVESIGRLPVEEYDPADDHKQLDHANLDDFVRAENSDGEVGFRVGSAVAAQNEVIKDLIERIELLEEQAFYPVCTCP